MSALTRMQDALSGKPTLAVWRERQMMDDLRALVRVVEAAVAVSDGSYSGKHDPAEFGARRRVLDEAVAALRATERAP